MLNLFKLQCLMQISYLKAKENADLVHENAEDRVVNGECMLCGDTDLVLSEIIFKANYGSRHDGKLTTLYLCSECFDGIIDSVIEE